MKTSSAQPLGALDNTRFHSDAPVISEPPRVSAKVADPEWIGCGRLPEGDGARQKKQKN
jgi:hypothetical protein